MRKSVIIVILIVVTISFISLSYRIYSKIHQNKAIEKNTVTLPAFSFYTLSDKVFANTDLPTSNAKIIFNFFSPACEHCQYMATQYLRHKEQLSDITLVMVTVADNVNTVKFCNEHHLSQLSNIIILRDKSFSFYKIFGVSTVPSFFIYEHQKLVKSVIGETKIENLLFP